MRSRTFAAINLPRQSTNFNKEGKGITCHAFTMLKLAVGPPRHVSASTLVGPLFWKSNGMIFF